MTAQNQFLTDMDKQNRTQITDFNIPENWLANAAIFGLIGLFLALLGSKMTIVDHDMFHEMALAREIIENGYFPKKDIFSYIPTIEPVVHHEWGTGVILYLTTVASDLGAVGLLILKYLLTASIVLGCYYFICRKRDDKLIFSWIALLGISIGFGAFTTIRAQVFSVLFMVLLFHFLEQDRQGKKKWIFAWLPLYLLWLNMHAGFLIGFGLFILYMVARFFSEFFIHKRMTGAFYKIHYLLGVLIIMTILILINPYGFDYISYLWRAILLKRSDIISEWQALWKVPNPGIWLSLYILSLIIFIYPVTQKKVSDLTGVFFIGITACLSLWHFRYLPIYAIVWVCYVPGLIKDTNLGNFLIRTSKNQKNLLFLIWFLVGLVGVYFAISKQFWKLRIPTKLTEESKGVPTFPGGTVEFLKEQEFSGNIMVPFNAGSYMSWNLYPGVKVSMDSRFEVAYSYESVLENVNFYQAKPGWRKTLTRYQTDALLVPRWSPLDSLMERSNGDNLPNSLPQWRRVYIDDGYSLFIKSGLAEAFPFTDKTAQPIPATFP